MGKGRMGRGERGRKEEEDSREGLGRKRKREIIKEGKGGEGK